MMEYKVVYTQLDGRRPGVGPVDPARRLLRGRRLAEARLLGECLKGAKVEGMYADRHLVVLHLNDGRTLSLEPSADSKVTWQLGSSTHPPKEGAESQGLSGTGEMHFVLPSGVQYTWPWQEIMNRLIGATIVTCSADRQALNIHCKEVEIEFDVWGIEDPQSSTNHVILVFLPF